ncbi:glycoside hydrolase family 16 protein [Athelia psychrophila]|uniref:Glycoside hydrolase family 16 protein n=1 Tax=Athelia psychrophila TaxID=1759441 RepID=A0A166R7R5_9AGAM|nr:glycoside hydrolase family 16 protein [Fibularhizoctonia sp. CBS 109695]
MDQMRFRAGDDDLLPPSAGRFNPGRPGHGASSSISSKYSLAPNPAEWGPIALGMEDTEDDDHLHNPDPARDVKNDGGGSIFTGRGVANLGCIVIIVASIMTLFAGYPIISHFTKKPTEALNQGGFNVGGTNATGQIPKMPGNFALIDLDTPQSAYTIPSYEDPTKTLDLVFSDEFNLDGRTFYPGDDPFWEAPNLHYWQTNDLEWYDPSAATTKGGALRLTLSKVEDLSTNHNMSYRSGMIQSWNKFCFTGGLIETAVTLPGTTNIAGLWPAVWTMGNLGRAGFGASLEGMWPYSYDSCDVGTLANQTNPGAATPLAAVTNGDPSHDNMLSYLPGQRLSACTCPGESHPGPVKANGDYVGRSSPEIDIFEATISDGSGAVSQSAQWAPFNAAYGWLNNTANLKIYNATETILNTYIGGAYQQTTSGLSITNQSCYEIGGNGCFSIYGFEYKPGFDNSYVTWINNGQKVWTMMGAGMGADSLTEIGARPVPQEPMYIIANLGFSPNFGYIDFDGLTFPTTMSVDYIRVYQPPGEHNTGCDPVGFPTKSYIDTYLEAYTNNNLTGWVTSNQTIPKNRLNGGC